MENFKEVLKKNLISEIEAMNILQLNGKVSDNAVMLADVNESDIESAVAYLKKYFMSDLL